MQGFSGIVATTCLLLLVVPGGAVARADRSAGKWLKLQMIDGRPVVKGVLIDGHGPYTFLLDTGAESNAASEELATRLNWRAQFGLQVVTNAGTVLRKGYVASSVAVGPAHAPGQEFVIAPLDEIRRLSPDIDGVLGQAFLSRFDYLLDFRRGRLVLDVPPPGGGVSMPFALSNGRMVAATSMGRLIVDSGANALVLRQTAPDAVRGEGVLLTGAGIRNVQTGQISLGVGHRTFHRVVAAFIPDSKQDDADPDGLLPVYLFGSLYVSNSGGYFIVDPE